MPTQEFARRPVAGEYAPYFEAYLGLVDGTDIFWMLGNQISEIRELLEGSPESVLEELHDPYTWTIKQAMGHIIDTERVFGYRACCIAANDTTELPGFNENEYVDNINYDVVKMADLLDEFEWLRRGNLAMLKRIQPECWDREGIAGEKSISVRALAFLMVGHVKHHSNVFVKRLAV